MRRRMRRKIALATALALMGVGSVHYPTYDPQEIEP